MSTAGDAGAPGKPEAGKRGDGGVEIEGQLQRQFSGIPDGTGPSKIRPEHLGQEEKLMGMIFINLF